MRPYAAAGPAMCALLALLALLGAHAAPEEKRGECATGSPAPRPRPCPSPRVLVSRPASVSLGPHVLCPCASLSQIRSLLPARTR